ncbi:MULTISPECIES: flagellar basal body rod protein FlgB [Candidatus Accumulibacter]|uniref:flagellar basal body rod protein FlgB n=1 Tax=Candidatus Accumulibacter TaxID=327159 RepID=UPI002D1FBB0A|nr:flagellar basal body rod protein FlgB [Accumulibacter sp.]
MLASKLDSALFAGQQALTLRAYRQQVLAGNIANADTPHYQARDFDFATTLKDALAGRGEGNLNLVTTSERHFQGTADSGPVRLMYRQTSQASADGNTVDMDVEQANFAENAIFYEAGMSFLSGKVKTLLAALQP